MRHSESLFYLWTVAFAIGAVAVMLLIVGAVKAGQCQATSAMMRVPGSYSLATGCMIQVNGAWLPLKNYIVVEGE